MPYSGGGPSCEQAVEDYRRSFRAGETPPPRDSTAEQYGDVLNRGSYFRHCAVPDTTATHVKFVVTANQCTGQPSYQGDQDSDPDNNSDCRVGQAPFVPRDTEVHATELQVFADDATVDGKEVTAG